MRGLVAILALPVLAAACTPQPMSPERAHEVCSDRAREAAGPTGRVTIGANSNSGPFVGAEIGLSADYLAGRDPLAVYDECYQSRTGGQMPTRQPDL